MKRIALAAISPSTQTAAPDEDIHDWGMTALSYVSAHAHREFGKPRIVKKAGQEFYSWEDVRNGAGLMTMVDYRKNKKAPTYWMTLTYKGEDDMSPFPLQFALNSPGKEGIPQNLVKASKLSSDGYHWAFSETDESIADKVEAMALKYIAAIKETPAPQAVPAPPEASSWAASTLSLALSRLAKKLGKGRTSGTGKVEWHSFFWEKSSTGVRVTVDKGLTFPSYKVEITHQFEEDAAPHLLEECIKANPSDVPKSLRALAKTHGHRVAWFANGVDSEGQMDALLKKVDKLITDVLTAS